MRTRRRITSLRHLLPGNFQTKGQQTIAIPPNAILPGGVTPPNTPTFAETGLPIDAFNPFNPFGQIISGGSRARLAEFGNRKIDSDVDAFLTTLGFKGDKLFDGNWGYDAGFRYSQVKDTENGTFVSVNRFKRILNAADPIYDPALSGLHRHNDSIRSFWRLPRAHTDEPGAGRLRNDSYKGRPAIETGYVRFKHLHDTAL